MIATHPKFTGATIVRGVKLSGALPEAPGTRRVSESEHHVMFEMEHSLSLVTM